MRHRAEVRQLRRTVEQLSAARVINIPAGTDVPAGMLFFMVALSTDALRNFLSEGSDHRLIHDSVSGSKTIPGPQ